MSHYGRSDLRALMIQAAQSVLRYGSGPTHRWAVAVNMRKGGRGGRRRLGAITGVGGVSDERKMASEIGTRRLRRALGSQSIMLAFEKQKLRELLNTACKPHSLRLRGDLAGDRHLSPLSLDHYWTTIRPQTSSRTSSTVFNGGTGRSAEYATISSSIHCGFVSGAGVWCLSPSWSPSCLVSGVSGVSGACPHLGPPRRGRRSARPPSAACTAGLIVSPTL